MASMASCDTAIKPGQAFGVGALFSLRARGAKACSLVRNYCMELQNELNSFLWTIKREPPSYFFGTIHVPYTRVWDFIPENSKKAFQQSHIVYFELDLTDPYTISALTSCQLLPQGKNLQDVLPRDIYRRLKRHLEYVKLMMPSWMTPDQRGKGLYADYLFNAIAGNWEQKRPVWVMLMVNSLTEVDIKSRGVPVLDLFLAQEAERLRKQTGAVEKVEEQCHPLNGLNFSQVVFALNQTLLQQESLRAGSFQIPYTTEDLIKHYNCGDLSSIIFNHDTSQVPNFVNASLPAHERITAQEIDSYFRQELIYKRNERMGRRVKDLLEEHPDKSFFFAFGAGHFMGNNTVIDVLRREGYEVEHTPAGQAINKLIKHVAVRYTHSSLLKNHKGEIWKLIPIMVLFHFYLLCQAVSLFTSLSFPMFLIRDSQVGLPPFGRICAEGTVLSLGLFQGRYRGIPKKSCSSFLKLKER
ncbi:hypothetical protein IHE44_0011277 [Lamprotornis superbus]|uniref:Metalloprotease TIKI n=1 Tax=Lamprotornis superbus TaxID=245042 RepID=A0A835NGC4_9PASS|nr:hypothetical protein IHE44_0011277 [Lamprotornis superbus]